MLSVRRWRRNINKYIRQNSQTVHVCISVKFTANTLTVFRFSFCGGICAMRVCLLLRECVRERSGENKNNYIFTFFFPSFTHALKILFTKKLKVKFLSFFLNFLLKLIVEPKLFPLPTCPCDTSTNFLWTEYLLRVWVNVAFFFPFTIFNRLRKCTYL